MVCAVLLLIPADDFLSLRKRFFMQANAMGTFNILNGEDRRVAAALVVDNEGASEE